MVYYHATRLITGEFMKDQLNKVYSGRDLWIMLREMEPLFDMVRLIDPGEMFVYEVSEDGHLTRTLKIWPRRASDRRSESEASGGADSVTAGRVIPRTGTHIFTRYMRLGQTRGGEGASGDENFGRGELYLVLQRPVLVRACDMSETAEAPGNVSGASYPMAIEVALNIRGCQVDSEVEWALRQVKVLEHEQRYLDRSTRAYNRRYLEEIQETMPVPGDYPDRLSVLLLTLQVPETAAVKAENADQFAEAATSSHAEELMGEVVRVARRHVRGGDAIVRVEADELVILLQGCARGNAILKAREIEESIRAAVPQIGESDLLIGCAATEVFLPDAHQMDQLLREAHRNRL